MKLQIYQVHYCFVAVQNRTITTMFIVDQGMATMDAVKASWAATDAQKGGIILLAIVAGLIGMAGSIALGIGLLFTIPVSYAIFTAAYRQMYPA